MARFQAWRTRASTRWDAPTRNADTDTDADAGAIVARNLFSSIGWRGAERTIVSLSGGREGGLQSRIHHFRARVHV